MRCWIGLCALSVLIGGCDGTTVRSSAEHAGTSGVPTTQSAAAETVKKTDAEWKRILSPNQYYILREKGTERAFTGKYWNSMAEGMYSCAACGSELFTSGQKFTSECGWPAFSQAVSGDRVKLLPDDSHGMRRTEVQCARCGGHLGHVFDDGPPPTHKRYCINSEALVFQGK